MTTSQEVEQYADWFGDSYPATVAYLQQYAEMIQKYEDAVAENVRLREAMNKYSEDEILLIERCAKACEVMGFKIGIRHPMNPQMTRNIVPLYTMKEPKK